MRRPESAPDPLGEALTRLGSRERVLGVETSAFRSVAGDTTKVVIAGCGSLGMRVLAGARQAGLNVVAFADNNPALQLLREGVPVLAPSEAVSRHNHEAFFVVAIHNGSSVRAQLRKLGCRCIVPYPMFFWQFSRHMPWEDRLELPHRILEKVEQIREGYELLAEGRSRTEFAAQIAWRCSLDFACLPEPDSFADMYFDPDVMRLSDDEVLVDCGAFDGDSLRLFLKRVSTRFKHVYALEPDPTNCRALERYLASLPEEQSRRICVLPFAVGDRNGPVSFDVSGTAGSRMTAESSVVIQCRRLDDLLRGPAPTLIKMDIEGAEPAAIRGAVSTIQSARPILAVCAYHKCEHLWTLPTILCTALPEYQLVLRRYAEECWETVYYAVPPERMVPASHP